jgi:hypothetical protein
MSLIQTEVPERLMQQANRLVEHGWANNMQELIVESLRRYLESHPENLQEQFVMDDVEWGLRGKD